MLKNHTDFDDPRVGVRAVSASPKSAFQDSICSQSKRDRKKNHRTYHLQLLNAAILMEIDDQLINVESFCRNVEQEPVLTACQRLIAILENFRRKYNKAKHSRLAD